MAVLTSVRGQENLPRYFAQVFQIASKINTGRLEIVLPDGRCFQIYGDAPGHMVQIEIHNPDCFARLIRDGDLGFAEAYLDGWWSTPDLQAFMDLVHADNDALFNGFPGMGLVRIYERVRHWLRSNSKTQAKKNISHHYDLGNDFYGLWLDPSMTYSSAIYADGSDDLEQAQAQKYASMVDLMGVQPGDHVLEIGCGWGGFAEYAAKERGLRVTCLTISQEQFNFAVDRIEKAGLSDKVEFRLQDYRDEQGLYDGIASIEMFEAVGEKYWPIYFETVKNRLRPGKKATLQIITVKDEVFHQYRKGVDFIQKYIFPGGMLPGPTILAQQVRSAGLKVDGSVEFGQSYSKTLRQWHDTFDARWTEISALGFDERFKRMWDFYLTSCAATFRYKNCDVTQITVQRPE